LLRVVDVVGAEVEADGDGVVGIGVGGGHVLVHVERVPAVPAVGGDHDQAAAALVGRMVRVHQVVYARQGVERDGDEYRGQDGELGLDTAPHRVVPPVDRRSRP